MSKKVWKVYLFNKPTKHAWHETGLSETKEEITERYMKEKPDQFSHVELLSESFLSQLDFAFIAESIGYLNTYEERLILAREILNHKDFLNIYYDYLVNHLKNLWHFEDPRECRLGWEAIEAAFIESELSKN